MLNTKENIHLNRLFAVMNWQQPQSIFNPSHSPAYARKKPVLIVCKEAQNRNTNGCDDYEWNYKKYICIYSYLNVNVCCLSLLFANACSLDSCFYYRNFLFTFFKLNYNTENYVSAVKLRLLYKANICSSLCYSFFFFFFFFFFFLFGFFCAKKFIKV